MLNHASNGGSVVDDADFRAERNMSMTNNSHLLSELTPGPNWDRITVRVSRMWESISKTKEVYSINLQLLDVHSLLDKYGKSFEERSIYEIESFNVYPSQPDYRSIDEDLMIILRRDTHVKMLPPTMYKIPKYKFGFVDDDILAQRVDKLTQLTDIAGVLRSISDIVQLTTRTGCQTVKRELTISTGNGKTLSITLWADKTKLIDVPHSKSTNQPSTVIFTSMVVKLFKGDFTFSSTNATKLYTNIEQSYIPNLATSEGSSVTTIEHLQHRDAPKSDNEIITTISNMLSEITADDCHGKKYVINETVMKINTSAGWSYLSFPICKKTVTKEATCFTCPKCKNNSVIPVNRYRLTMEVFDHTASSTVIAFDRDATCLIKRSVTELIDLSKKDNGNEMVEKIPNNLTGSEARFEFKPTKYDIDNRGKTLTVSRISNINQPNTPLTQQSTNLKVEEITDIEGTQLTAESNMNTRKNVDRKGKQKINQETETSEMTDLESGYVAHPKSVATRGLLIKEEMKKKRGKQKMQGRTPDKKKKK